MDNLITIQVTDEQLAELQCLVAERAEDANLMERALAVPIPDPVQRPAETQARDAEESEVSWQENPEPKYCGHCSGGIYQRYEELLTCHKCGGFYHEYRLGCQPAKWHPEPQPCEHPDGQNGDTWATCHDCGNPRWLRIPEHASCPKCGGILDSDGVCQNARAADEECPHGWTWDTSCRQCGRLPEVASCSHGVRNGCRECRGDYVPDAEPRDPAMAQLQRVGLPMPEPDIVVERAVAAVGAGGTHSHILGAFAGGT